MTSLSDILFDDWPPSSQIMLIYATRFFLVPSVFPSPRRVSFFMRVTWTADNISDPFMFIITRGIMICSIKNMLRHVPSTIFDRMINFGIYILMNKLLDVIQLFFENSNINSISRQQNWEIDKSQSWWYLELNLVSQKLK